MVNYERMLNTKEGVVFCSESHNLQYRKYFSNSGEPWRIFSSIGQQGFLERLISTSNNLDKIADVLGAATVSEAYEIKKLIKEGTSEVNAPLKVVNSGTIDRYCLLWKEKPLRYIKDSYKLPVIPLENEGSLPSKRLKQSKLPKIIIAGMTKRLECAIDLNGEYLAGKSTSIIFSSQNLKYLIGLLNSKLISFYYINTFGGNKLQGDYLRIGTPQLRSIPIRMIDFDNPKDVKMHDKMVNLVETMLDLHKKLGESKVPDEKTKIQRQIDATDKKIDKLVYDLYGLTDEEIKIIEQSTK
ncbi:MAG: hypothetical protein JW804_04560 [Sedimentisphaerales bacterium]|nr:hypothetical protein [Sedimentisphaerales bacterium]